MREATDAARFPFCRCGKAIATPAGALITHVCFRSDSGYRFRLHGVLYKPTRTDEKAVGVMVAGGPSEQQKMQRSLPLLALCGTLALALPSAGLALVDKDASAQSAFFQGAWVRRFHPGFGRSEAGRPRR